MYIYLGGLFMKRCPVCDYLNDDSAVVCGTCGAPCDSSREYGALGFDNYMSVRVKTNGMAIASMVLGIVSVLPCCCFIGIIPGILAVVFGFIARSTIDKSMGAQKGKEMALTGIILGFLSIGLTVGYSVPMIAQF
jgi:hypothetical protein